ncbi:MAG: hypothetical protein ABR915_04535 [Thermoguttaceae bacterium]
MRDEALGKLVKIAPAASRGSASVPPPLPSRYQEMMERPESKLLEKDLLAGRLGFQELVVVQPEVALPRRNWVRITRPEQNAFLLAPLAKAAGGTEACGTAVFAAKEDPDYQHILRTFEAAQHILNNPPRADLPGSTACGPGCQP